MSNSGGFMGGTNIVEDMLDTIETRGVEVVEQLVAGGVPRGVALAAVAGKMIQCGLNVLMLMGRKNHQIRPMLKSALIAAREKFEAETKAAQDKPRIILPGGMH